MTQVSDEYSETVIIRDEMDDITVALPDEPTIEVGLLEEPEAQTVQVVTEPEIFDVAIAEPAPAAPVSVTFDLLSLVVATGGVRGVWTTDAAITTGIAWRVDGEPDWETKAQIEGLREYHQDTITATFSEEITYELQLLGTDIAAVNHTSSTYHFHIDSGTHEVVMGMA